MVKSASSFIIKFIIKQYISSSRSFIIKQNDDIFCILLIFCTYFGLFIILKVNLIKSGSLIEIRQSIIGGSWVLILDVQQQNK